MTVKLYEVRLICIGPDDPNAASDQERTKAFGETLEKILDAGSIEVSHAASRLILSREQLFDCLRGMGLSEEVIELETFYQGKMS